MTMKRLMAVLLTAGVLQGSFPLQARAQLVEAAAAHAPPNAVPGALGAVNLALPPSLASLSAPSLAPSLPNAALTLPGVRPVEAQAAAQPTPAFAFQAAAPAAMAAPAQTPQAVDRHPAIGIIKEVQRAGGEALLRQLDAARTPAQFEAVAAALPAGAAKVSVMAFSKALAGQSFSGGSDSVGALFDNANRPELLPSADAPAPRGFWAKVAKAVSWRLPRPLAVLQRYAQKKAEASRPQASLIDISQLEVSSDKLRYVPDSAKLPEAASLADRGGSRLVGQERAVESLRFGLTMEDPGYNVIVTGADGTGRATAVRELLGEIAPARPNPGDVVAAVNFKDTDSPLFLRMAVGEGSRFAAGVKQLVAAYPKAVQEAFEHGPAGKQANDIMHGLRARAAARMDAFHSKSSQVQVAGGLGLEVSLEKIDEKRAGIVAKPLKDGKELEPGELDALLAAAGVSKEEFRRDMDAKAEPLSEELQQLLTLNMKEQAEAQQRIEELEKQVATGALSALLPPLASVAEGRATMPEDAAWEASVQERFERWRKKMEAARVAGAFGILITPKGLAVTHRGKPVSEKLFDALKAQGEVPAGLDWEALVGEALRTAEGLMGEQEAIQKAVMAEAGERRKQAPPLSPERQAAVDWLMALVQDLIESLPMFKGAAPGFDPAERYQATLLVDNAAVQGAPVVFEHNPTFGNLFGSADENEKVMRMPDGSMVKAKAPGGPKLAAGSFLRAGGGYLVLDLLDVLREPGVYPALMRQVRNGKAHIVEGGLMGLTYGRMAGGPARVHEVDAQVKVVFIGSPYLKSLLAHEDEDFARSFRAVAEFESALRVSAETVKGMVRFMAEAVGRSEGALLDFGREAVAGVLEHAARLAESNEKLTAQFGEVASLMKEASYWARQAGRPAVSRPDVDKAVVERSERSGMSRRHMLKDYYGAGIFAIEAEGSEVGQNNGLAVMGDFGVPMRITYVAYARPGGDLMVSTEQEAHTSGNSWDKSVADIKGFFKSLLGRERPIPVQVSVSIEQNYGGVDGDSATQTMSYGILSALSGVPIKQGIAMTGSMDQKGNVQVIGGVNHKIEGVFDVFSEILRRKGKTLDGTQGVIIPVGNVPDLALRPDIVQAVKDGKFHVYAVSNFRQGVEVLTGEPYAEVVGKAQAYIDSVRAGAKEGK